jgi:hypothetical protein
MCRLWRRKKSFLPLPEFEPRITNHEPDNIKIVEMGKSEKKYSALATVLLQNLNGVG